MGWTMGRLNGALIAALGEKSRKNHHEEAPTMSYRVATGWAGHLNAVLERIIGAIGVMLFTGMCRTLPFGSIAFRITLLPE